MANVTYPPQRQLSVGEVLDLSFGIYRVTLGKCLLLAALGVIAGQLGNFYLLVKGTPPVRGAAGMQQLLSEMRDPSLWVVSIISAVLAMAFYGAVLLRQRAIIGQGAIGGEIAAALQRMPAFIGLLILIAVGCGVCFVPAIVTGGALRVLLALAGLILLSYGIVAISCAQTVLFLEHSGPVDSLSRSWRLTSGSFWRLSLIYTVAFIVLLVLYVAIGAIGGFVAGILGRGDVALAMAVGQVVGIALGALATPFYGALALAVLGDLKVRKEGADLEQRISATA